MVQGIDFFDEAEGLAKGRGLVIGRVVSEVHPSIIEKSDIYQKGLIRFSDDRLRLVNSATGTLYDTLEEAIQGTAGLGLSRVNVFTGQYGAFSPDESSMGQLSDLVQNINTYLISSNSEAQAYRSQSTILKNLEGKQLRLSRLAYSDVDASTISKMAGLYDEVFVDTPFRKND